MPDVRSRSRQSGATAVEYALMLAAFAGAIIFVLSLFGATLNRAREGVAGSPDKVMMGGAAPDGGFILQGSPEKH
jgi:Flp pilus assembly pilin Flp